MCLRKLIIGLIVAAAIYSVGEELWGTTPVTTNQSVSPSEYYPSNHGYKPVLRPGNDVKYTTDCTYCNRTGICRDCGGTGRSNFDGALAAWGCQLCDKTGNCHKCQGKGYINHY